MNIRRTSLSVVALLATTFGAYTQGENQALTKRVENLETRLAEVEDYLASQAQAAQELAGALDQSEKEGFTYGMNPESRHTLLRGLRQVTSAAQKGVPGAPAKDVTVQTIKGD